MRTMRNDDAEHAEKYRVTGEWQRNNKPSHARQQDVSGFWPIAYVWRWKPDATCSRNLKEKTKQFN